MSRKYRILAAASGVALVAAAAWYAVSMAPPRLLERRNWEGRAFLTRNPDYDRQFPGEVRALPHVWVPAEKAPGVRRVLLLGGSAAAGVPLTDYHLGRLLEARWKERYPGEALEVVNLPLVGRDAAGVRDFVRQAMEVQPDVVVGCGSPLGVDNNTLAEEVRARRVTWVQCLMPDPAVSAVEAGAEVVDMRPVLRAWQPGEGDVGGLFPDGVHLTFTGRAVVAEKIADRLAALWGLAPDAGTQTALPELRAQIARDVMFNGYDEHDMWSWAVGEAASGAGRAGLPELQAMADAMRRRAVLGWDTTALVVAYERAVLQNPDDALTHFTAGRLLGARGEGERAEEAFVEGFRLMPLHPEARLNHAAMQLARGDTESAAASLAVLQKGNPNAPGLARMESALALRQGDAEAAAAHLERHLAETPDDVVGWQMLSDLQWRLGREEAAQESQERARVVGQH